MQNVLSVLKRDFVRLFKSPATLIVVVALIILPSLYTWVNVYAFWNPYDNTSNMTVCYVNEDEGADTELAGHINVGEMIDSALHLNNQLKWEFTDRETALSEVRSGKAYAAFIVGKDFSSNLASIADGKFEENEIEYYVNEKVNAVSPKVTDTGSTTLDETINSTFVTVITEKVVDKLDEIIQDANAGLSSAESNIDSKLTAARDSLSQTKSAAKELSEATNIGVEKVNSAKTSVTELHNDVDAVEEGLTKVQEGTANASQALMDYSNKVLPALNTGLTDMSTASSKATQVINSLSTDIQASLVPVKTALEQQKSLLNELNLLVSQLRTIASSLPDGAIKDQVNSNITSLETQIASVEASVTNLETLSNDITNNATLISNSSNSINSSLQNSTSNAISFNNLLYTTTIPTINNTLNNISGNAGNLATSVKTQHVLLNEIDSLLSQIDRTLSSLKTSAESSETSLGSFDEDLSSLQTDINSLSLSQRIKDLLEDGGLDATSIASFMGSPTTLKTESVYTINAYGSSMAPLFMNLTFWIGAFMLLVILRMRADGEGVSGLTDKQSYIARWILFGIFAILQSALCCAGVLMIGVQTVSYPALYLTSALASLTYLSLMYMLSTTLQHIGKGICVLLAFLQIPAATGLYPVELTTPFFQAVYQLLPFTYGINGLREAICGFYENDLLIYCLVLLAILVVSMLIGIFLRPRLHAFNSLFSRQIKERGLFVIEEVEFKKHDSRISEIVSYLDTKKEFKEGFANRANEFMNRYAHFRRYALFAFVAISITAALFFSNMSYEYKPAILTIWLICLIALMIFAILTEKANEDIMHQIQLDAKSDEEIRIMMNRGAQGRIDE